MKKTGIIFVAMGAALIIMALLLILYNQNENAHAGIESEIMLTDVQNAINERIAATATENETDLSSGASSEEKTGITEDEMPLQAEPQRESVVFINGYEYIGILSVPSLELELPVISDWDYTKLKFAPCREFGSVITNDLVIAAHNYKNHFGKLDKLKNGGSVTFTDMDGNIVSYSVTSVEKVKATAVEEVQHSGHALTLYTCTLDGMARIAVFCDKTE